MGIKHTVFVLDFKILNSAEDTLAPIDFKTMDTQDCNRHIETKNTMNLKTDDFMRY
jgi:hypothetical protein